MQVTQQAIIENITIKNTQELFQIMSNIEKTTLEECIASDNYKIWDKLVHKELNDVIKFCLQLDIPFAKIMSAFKMAIAQGNIDLIDTYLSHTPEIYHQSLFELFDSIEETSNNIEVNLEHVEALANKYKQDSRKLLKRFDAPGLENSNPEQYQKLRYMLDAPVSHLNLIHCAQDLGYSLRKNGICHGYTMRWIEATLLGEEALFINRTYKIAELFKRRISRPFPKLEQLLAQAEWKDKIWDLRAFYESLFLYHDVEFSNQIFGRFVNQLDIDTRSKIAESKAIKEQNGIFIGPAFRYDEFAIPQLNNTFSLIEETIARSAYHHPVCFYVNLIGDGVAHAISITYFPIEKKWAWMDVDVGLLSGNLSCLLEQIKSVTFSQLLEDKTMSYEERYRGIGMRTILLKTTASQELNNLLLTIPKLNHQNVEALKYILSIATLYSDEETVKLILNHCSPDDGPANMPPPLAITAQNDNLDMAEILLKKGANPNLEYLGKHTAIIAAATFNHLEMIKLLLAHGANPNHHPKYHTSSILRAIQNKQLDIMLTLLNSKRIDLNLPIHNGWTPILQAVHQGDFEILSELLKHKEIDINTQQHRGVTPLAIAIILQKVDIVHLLLEHGANPFIIGETGESHLYLAIQAANFKIVKTLIEYGTDISCPINIEENLLKGMVSQQDVTVVEKMDAYLQANRCENNKKIQILPSVLANILGHTDIEMLLSEPKANLRCLFKPMDEEDQQKASAACSSSYGG